MAQNKRFFLLFSCLFSSTVLCMVNDEIFRLPDRPLQLSRFILAEDDDLTAVKEIVATWKNEEKPLTQELLNDALRHTVNRGYDQSVSYLEELGADDYSSALKAAAYGLQERLFKRFLSKVDFNNSIIPLVVAIKERLDYCTQKVDEIKDNEKLLKNKSLKKIEFYHNIQKLLTRKQDDTTLTTITKKLRGIGDEITTLKKDLRQQILLKNIYKKKALEALTIINEIDKKIEEEYRRRVNQIPTYTAPAA